MQSPIDETVEETSYRYAKTMLSQGNWTSEVVYEMTSCPDENVKEGYLKALREEGYVFCEQCNERKMWDRKGESFFCPTCE